jgi:hypothetical protein
MGINNPVNLAVKSIIARTQTPMNALKSNVLKNLWLFIQKNTTANAKHESRTIKKIKKVFIIIHLLKKV